MTTRPEQCTRFPPRGASSPARIALGLLAALALLPLNACKRDATQERPIASSASAATAQGMPTIAVAELGRTLTSGEKPLLFHVGFEKLYLQAHIPNSEYLGPGSEAEGIARLRERVAELPRTANIVIYCGCCPWVRCPNIKPAYESLSELGFTNVKALLIPEDFGSDWAEEGFPVAKGE